tara:strand:+ start:3860 stop:4816 length:957 start_codon:yes stop_codon:yes gene_type:complete
MKIKSSPCPLCNSSKNLIIYKSNLNKNTEYNKFLKKEIFEDYKKVNSNLRYCFNCTLCFFDYRYSKRELDNLYSEGYAEKRSKYIKAFQEKANKRITSYKFRASSKRKLIVFENYLKFRKFQRKADVLDFGGWHGENIPEIAKQTNKYILDKSKHETSSGVSLISEIKSGQKFDFIMSTHVFEHLLKPLNDLKLLASVLKKDGLIYLEIPADIVGLIKKPPMYEHINYFSRNSIIKLASMANLDILSIELRKYPYENHETIAYTVLLQHFSTNKFFKKNNFLIKIINLFVDIIQYIMLNPIKYYLTKSKLRSKNNPKQ